MVDALMMDLAMGRSLSGRGPLSDRTTAPQDPDA